ncbi:hypothetical protein GCM10009809_35670 [Isoptericola hypogeus]|uniref:Peptidase S8/S53 domain-containing protein n=1 Tax=Isoptericola hypogeus TaxID=300179 RepID=A0ABN2JS88_9MICO
MPARDKIAPGLERTLDAGKPVDLWIELDAKADLTAASAIDDWDERGRAVAAELRRTAERSQRGVQARLRAHGVEFESFWAANAIKVSGADPALATQLAAREEVAGLWPSFAVDPPETTTEEAQATADAVEWGIENIKADQVWADEGATGEGIVVANIDTGVQYDHPALARQYRGNNGDGTFSHDYNWFDAHGTCRGAPCDDEGHGTHTMGTMVGADGAENHIGVAPGARWIATNGCCTDTTLMASAQWLLEPTDHDGNHPDAAMRPHVINNSWGSNLPSNQPFLEEASAAWAASGIFVTWSNGNMGPSCTTSGRPGSRTINYSVGAYDEAGVIASFSSRGPGQDGTLKPDIAAPGVDVRSSVPGGQYAVNSGTSMAAPHVAGAVALLWSARPAALGDVELTRELLGQSAIDTPDLSCGGTAEFNNVFGDGRLDAQALVDAAPAGPAGMLAGTVADADTGEPLSGVQLQVAGPMERTATTGSDGGFDIHLAVGTYDLTVTRYGFVEAVVTGVEVTADSTTERSVELTRLPSATVSGTVSDGSGQGWPLYAKVRVAGTPVTAFTDPATGDYSLVVPTGSTYDLTVEPLYPGYEPVTDTLPVTADVVRDHAPTVAPGCRAAGYAADCTPLAGGLVVGHVTDATTGAGVVGARVRSDDAPDEAATTTRSTADPGLGAGFYWMFSSLTGERPFTASKGSGYTAGTVTADVRPHAVATASFALGAGHLEVVSGAVTSAVELGGATTATIEVRNVGNAPATFELADKDQGFEIARADGGLVSSWAVTSAPGASLERLDVPVSPLRGAGREPAEGAAVAAAAEAGPWLGLADHPTAVMDNVAGAYRGVVYSVGGTADGLTPSAATYAYDPESLRWTERAAMPQGRMKPGGAFVDGRFYVIGGWGDPGTVVDETAIYDPRTDSWEGGAANPHPMAAAGVAALDGVVYSVGGCQAACGTRVVTAYDVESDSFERVADYPVPTAWLSCGAVGDRIVCAGGRSSAGESRDTYVYDPQEDAWRQAADMPRSVWAAGYAAADGTLVVSGGVADDALTNAGWAYDAAADSWTSLPSSGLASYRGGSACGFVKVGGSTGQFEPTAAAELLPGFDGCGAADAADAAWLTPRSTSVTVPAGRSAHVAVTLDSSALGQPGAYSAQLRLVEDTPFDVEPVLVTFRVDPPRTWGKVLGTVTGASCAGDASPLDGATVSLAGSTSTWSFTVPADGTYARWIDRGENPVRATAHKDGYVPESQRLRLGKAPTAADFQLERLGC